MEEGCKEVRFGLLIDIRSQVDRYGNAYERSTVVSMAGVRVVVVVFCDCFLTHLEVR